ncbi:hypothetical protein AGMMS49587_07960 [Spirochaetia bacterium]|nr:hypothetical protein AGMMS49587_07960 [Spirochaetia bacterium]
MAIAGHAGSGHCHSHSQYLQDDSGGLAAVLALFQEAANISLTIKEIQVTPGIAGSIRVETMSGGVGVCAPRRGITLQEARLAKGLEGRDAIRTQALVMEAFGRVYGQGVHETPVALQTAIANAAMDSFCKNFPEQFIGAEENTPHGHGRIAGTVLDFDGAPVSVLATVNGTDNGTGPVEDLEGNVFGGSKKIPMRALGMDTLPTIVIEGKVYSPGFSDSAEAPYFLVRADPRDDNPVVGNALILAGKALGYPIRLRDDVLRRIPGALEKSTRALGDAIIAGGTELKQARFSHEKVAALAKLAALISEDGAGISFMSDRLHEIVGGVGLMPGTAAVLSLIVPKAYRDRYVFPALTEDDLPRYVNIIKTAVRELRPLLPEAEAHLKAHAWQGDLDSLLSISNT